MIVYHIFDANRAHHVPKFINQLNKFSIKNQTKFHYILYNYNNKISAKYESVLSEISKDNFLLVQNDGRELFKKIKTKKIKTNRFIIHGFLPYKVLFMLLLTHKLQYFSWVCWGLGANKNNSIILSLKATFLKNIYKAFHSINVLMEADREILLKNFKIKTPVYVIPYWTTLKFYKDSEKLGNYFSDDKINILVGHTSHVSCQHIKLLSLLEKYKINDIRVICFLNYGDHSSVQEREEYIKKVVRHGQTLFGNKFMPIMNLLELKDYERIMKSIDVTIIPQKSHSGLGAIYRTILNKGSVFLCEKGNNDNWLRLLGIKVGYIGNITQANYSDFLLAINPEQKNKNKETLINNFAVDKLSEKWKSFFYGVKN